MDRQALIPCLVLSFCILVSDAQLTWYEVTNPKFVCWSRDSPCTELTYTLSVTATDGRKSEDWETPILTFQYKRKFGGYDCDYFQNKKTEWRFAYISRCQKGRHNGFEGSFMGSNTSPMTDFHLFFDARSGQTHALKEKLRSGQEIYDILSKRGKSRGVGEDQKDDMEFAEEADKKTVDHFGWSRDEDFPRLQNPELELMLQADIPFIRYCGGDRDDAAKLIFDVLNAGNAMFQRFNLTLVWREKEIRFLSSGTSAKLKVGGEKHNLRNLRTFGEQLVTRSNIWHAELGAGQMRGAPDASILFSALRDLTHSAGRAFFDTACGADGLAYAIVTGLEYTGVGVAKDVWDRGEPTPRPALVKQIAMTLVHEVGHILSLEHVDMQSAECRCFSDRGFCPMFYADSPQMSHEWSPCSVKQLEHRIARGREETDCLFQKDVFASASEILVPRSSVVDFWSSFDVDGTRVWITNKYMEEIRMFVSHTIVLQHGEYLQCNYTVNVDQRNFWTKGFGVFEICSKPSFSVQGVYLVDETRVSLSSSPRLSRATVTATFSQVDHQSHVVPSVGPVNHGMKITVICGFDGLFRSMSGQPVDAIRRIVFAISVADASLRLIGLTVRATGVRYFESRSDFEKMTRGRHNKETMFLFFTDGPDMNDSHSKQEPCSRDPVILSYDSDRMSLGVKVAHIIGHRLGLEDEAEPVCDCDTPYGKCFMNSNHTVRSPYPSPCSLTRLQNTNLAAFGFCSGITGFPQDSDLVVIMRRCAFAAFVFFFVIGSAYYFFHRKRDRRTVRRQ